MTHWSLTFSESDDHLMTAGIRLRSWAIPLLITFTPGLKEIAIGPFYVAHESIGVPF